MNPENPHDEEQRLAELFDAAMNHAPRAERLPPDRDFLGRLREQSMEVFASQGAEQARLSTRRKPMFVLAVRVLVASAAAVAVGVTIVWHGVFSGPPGPTLAEVLQKMGAAETIRYSIARADFAGHAWSERSGRTRWDLGSRRYEIADRKQVWSVDERANRVTVRPVSYCCAADSGHDPLLLLQLTGITSKEARKKLGDARPVERRQRGDTEYAVYRVELPAAEGEIQLEALVDAKTQRLESIEARSKTKLGIRPIGKVTVLAVDEPLDEDLFVVGDTLTVDGRIGKVIDLQGIVSVKPLAHARFTPVVGQILLKPGDWLRTDRRGANAVALRLVKQTDVTLGPGTLVELVSPKQMRLASGVVKIVASADAPVELLAAGDQKITVKGTKIFRLQDDKLAELEKPPLWLQGFEGATSNESLGSLVAKVDGRDVPLTVGYHKVTVDVRDQIARTVIEESFVNHTDNRLEGVFYFPLPQDASISGFAMWIGDKLVEADVVEKQRAREIYETILREKRDPGLLEWSGGNIFKARVFPIFAHSEKRIKITYTQVLPLRGNAYRYSYALKSELLQQHPLRELAITVNVHSAAPLAAISSPTHTCRLQKTKHSARAEFTAQQYTPTRDFEVVVELDRQRPDVVMIPHRRGEDGYFLLQVMPPSPGGDSDREILTEDEPLDLLILADTSASMDDASRRRQAEFLAALLGALTPQDSFNLATCDVETHWVFPTRRSASDESVEVARELLADRISLGWTNLDKAFAAVLDRTGANTHVVYLGDGIATGKDSDPVRFVNRLRRLYKNKTATCHAVTLGSSFEPAVVRAIGSLGGGSVRTISGQQGPAKAALELLGEITRPPVRELKVTFEGLRTARVYPEQLPNLVAGTQQILLGRYLPTGKDQQGRVVITGQQGDRTLELETDVSLADAERGNSFIPRLWARKHLDCLLNQGDSPAVRDEIIALSEEYHIMTPYTSLLVLESDADRERFKVKRRFQMRDGEKFFAEGRDKVDYALVQQAMQQAGTWRLGLRRAVLQQLSTLGRNTRAIERSWSRRLLRGESSKVILCGGQAGIGPARGASYGAGVYSDVGLVDRFAIDESAFLLDGRQWGLDGAYHEGAMGQPMVGKGRLGKRFPTSGEILSQALGPASSPMSALERFEVEEAEKQVFWAGVPLSVRSYDLRNNFHGLLSSQSLGTRCVEYCGREGLVAQASPKPFALGPPAASMRYRFTADGDIPYFRRFGKANVAQWRMRGEPRARPDWLGTLFAPLPPAPKDPEPAPKSTWPAPARALAESLLRSGQLVRSSGGLEIEGKVEYFDPLRGRLTSQSDAYVLASAGAWLIRGGGPGCQTVIHWCGADERGVLSKAFLLGRVRKSEKRDLQRAPLGLDGYVQDSIERSYRRHKAEVRREEDGQTWLILTYPQQADQQTRVLIDTEKDAILRIEIHDRDKLKHTTTFDRFVEVAGAWWAGRVERTDEQGRRMSLTTRTFKRLDQKNFDRRMREALAGRDRVQLIRQPLVDVKQAKQAVADHKDTFDDRLTMVLHFWATSQWDRVMEHWEAAEQLATDKPGVRWVRYALMENARRREELKKLYRKEAASLARLEGNEAVEALFLADHVRNRSGRILEANEKLALLDVLRPVYQSAPAMTEAMKRWTLDRVGQLDRTARAEEAFALRRQLAADYPHDADLQRQYAQHAFNRGQYDAAYTWLETTLADGRKWYPHEENWLRDAYAGFLRSQDRYPELVDYLANWIKRNPETNSPYAQYLTSLIYTDRAAEADRLVQQWFSDGRQAERLPPAVLARLDAAINYALGNKWGLSSDSVEARWQRRLEKTAMLFANHKAHCHVADQIMHNGNFQRTDACRRVRKKIAGVLLAEINTLSPERIARYVDWIWPNDPAVATDTWKKIARRITRRWESETNADLRHNLGNTLAKIRGRISHAQHLAFLRRQLDEGPEKHRTGYANRLFNHLLAQSWSAKTEDEAFSLLDRLTDSNKPHDRLISQISTLHRLTDRMIRARYDARMRKVKHQEKLTRTELAEKNAEALRLARAAYADRVAQRARDLDRPLADWFTIERLTIEARLGRKLDDVVEACWELVGPRPTARPKHPDGRYLLDQMLRDRALAILSNLAARKTAKPQQINRLLRYFDDGIAIAPKADDWKQAKYLMLVALDRPKELEKALRGWIRPESADSHWRRVLAYLLAEQGKLPEAIAMLEKIEAADELTSADYRVLARWYMAVDQAEAHQRAVVESFKTAPEGQLCRWLHQQLRPWQRRGRQMPTELDKNVPLVFATVFAKSGNPANYLPELQQFYRGSRDFRLLSGLADAVIGHTSGKIYPVLQRMGGVLGEIREEATVDALIEHLQKVRRRAKTPVDHRALDLVELLVERRAAELANQPGPHAKRALVAMQRAFRREWSPGEPRLMADFLHGLGHISHAPLAEEQLAELALLHERAKPGSADRLHIAWRRAQTIWNTSQGEPAVDMLSFELAEHEKARGGILPEAANGPLETLISYHEDQRHYAAAEKVLLEQLRHPTNEKQRNWLTERLYRTYISALHDGGQVSLGQGVTLYRALRDRFVAELKTKDQGHRRRLIERLCSLFHVARDEKINEFRKDLRKLAFSTLPELLRWHTNSPESIIQHVSSTLRDLLGPREGLALLIERIENQPSWWRYQRHDAWSHFGWQLAKWRSEAGKLGELQPRLLAIVTTELRRDLRSRSSRNRTIYHRRHNEFWKEQTDAFARVAEEVLAERKHSGASVKYIADYLYHGLDRYDRAIEVLLDAHRRKILDEGGQRQLTDYFHRRNRYGEAIPILEPLVKKRPNSFHYRFELMRAYHRTKQPEALLSLLEETDARFHKGNRWTEDIMGKLAWSCLDNHLYRQSAAYYEEAISARQRSHPRRGIGDETLSSHYRHQAGAYAALNNTTKAVDAAAGAIVCWGPRHNRRRQATETLREVLRRSPDLDAYVAELDKQVEEQGADRPIIRKAIGQVYHQKGQLGKAIAQLALALQLQPDDAETHQTLINCYDQAEDNRGAIDAVLGRLQLNRRDVGLYRDLGNRLNDVQQHEQAERAYTSMVEMLPNESESHTELAKIRQSQDRWADAADHWRQLARIRALEPTGLVNLAKAQIRLKQWDRAAETLDRLRAKSWPARFDPVKHEIRALQNQIDHRPPKD